MCASLRRGAPVGCQTELALECELLEPLAAALQVVGAGREADLPELARLERANDLSEERELPKLPGRRPPLDASAPDGREQIEGPDPRSEHGHVSPRPLARRGPSNHRPIRNGTTPGVGQRRVGSSREENPTDLMVPTLCRDAQRC